MISTTKSLKRIHEKCTDILEMIESAEYMIYHHAEAIQRLKRAGLSYSHHINRIKINTNIVERLKSYYLNQILKLTK